jgi:ribonuclease R
MGLSLSGGNDPQPKHYAKLLSQVRARPDWHLIQTVMLRSLNQAVYSPDNTGHFGLALEAYAHFTSPIRRYPDLLVHRAIKHVLAGKAPSRFAYTNNDMLHHGENCSMTERRADEATRDVVDWLKCEYMMDKVGEEFDGFVTGVTSFGIFVELEEIYAEGLVHVTSLKNDYYHFDPVNHCLIGERTRKKYRLSDRVQVRVARVDLDEKKIDFELIQHYGGAVAQASEAKNTKKKATKSKTDAAVKKKRSSSKKSRSTKKKQTSSKRSATTRSGRGKVKKSKQKTTRKKPSKSGQKTRR